MPRVLSLDTVPVGKRLSMALPNPMMNLNVCVGGGRQGCAMAGLHAPLCSCWVQAERGVRQSQEVYGSQILPQLFAWLYTVVRHKGGRVGAENGRCLEAAYAAHPASPPPTAHQH